MARKMSISDKVMKETPKYEDIHKLDSLQTDPKEMKTINFKQDYIVMIRKKLYYAISQHSQEEYLRVYQVNNFISISTSHSVESRPATCSVTIKGGERVICADRDKDENGNFSSEDDPTKFGDGNWKDLLNNWLNIDDTKNTIGSENWDAKGASGKDFKNLMKAREAKYGWRFAEKCDWEPMDEIYIFGKSRKEKDKNGQYKFNSIFFGYIDSVQKTYQQGQSLISIQASDQLKLLQLSMVTNFPSKLPGVVSGGGIDIKYSFPQDELGCFAINDDFFESSNIVENSMYAMFTNVFAGKPPYEIINRICMDAGIPPEYLIKRIEKVKKIPFVATPRGDGSIGDLFSAELKNRLNVCSEAATKLFMEFFCDEEGNIVFKIPNYALGSNQLLDNNMGKKFNQNLLSSIGPKIIEKSSGEVVVENKPVQEVKAATSTSKVEEVVHVVQKGDTLWDIAKKYLGNATLWKDIYAIPENKAIIKNPDLIYPGQKIIIKKTVVTSAPTNTTTTISNTNVSSSSGSIGDSGKVIHTVVSGDTLWDIAKKYLGNGALWPTIYNIPENKKTIDSRSGTPNLIYAGQKIVIYTSVKEEVKGQQIAIDKEVKSEKNANQQIVDGTTLSMTTDPDIPPVKSDEVISFTLIDTDKEIYNMFEVQIETPIVDSNTFPWQAIRRVVPDFDSIIRFGLRPHPGLVNTPLITNVIEAEIFGIMLIAKSLAKRYSGSLTLIEESSIKVGNPIRLHLYDEHPFKETGYFSKEKYPEQAVFYVTGISRSISPKDVSHMTLTLQAGRMMGQQSIFDICLPLYRFYFEEHPIFDILSSLDKYEGSAGEAYEIKASDSISKIIKDKYGVLDGEEYNNIMQMIIKLNPSLFGVGAGIIDNISLIVGKTIILPTNITKKKDPNDSVSGSPKPDPNNNTYPGNLIRINSKDATNVRKIQQALKNAGYYKDGNVDGVFGPKTEAAIKQYQGDKKLTVDGIVGPSTWGSLFK